jgi:hypothetical protein
VIHNPKIKGDFLRCGNLGTGRSFNPVMSNLCRPYPRQQIKPGNDSNTIKAKNWQQYSFRNSVAA